MPELDPVTERFLADMTPFLDGLDAGIAKAVEFADACKEAEDATVSMALAADESALVISSAMGKATRSVEELALAMKALDDKHVEVSASVSGIAGPVAGAIAQVEALKAAMAGLDDPAAVAVLHPGPRRGGAGQAGRRRLRRDGESGRAVGGESAPG